MSIDDEFSAFAKGAEETQKNLDKQREEKSGSNGLWFQGKKQKTRVSVYIRCELKEKIVKLAEKHKCAESSIVEQCLERVLGKESSKKILKS
jgi:hypothetical protein